MIAKGTQKERERKVHKRTRNKERFERIFQFDGWPFWPDARIASRANFRSNHLALDCSVARLVLELE